MGDGRGEPITAEGAMLALASPACRKMLKQIMAERDTLRAELEELRHAFEFLPPHLSGPITRDEFLVARMAYLGHMRDELGWPPPRMILAINIDDVAHAQRLLVSWDERTKKRGG